MLGCQRARRQETKSITNQFKMPFSDKDRAGALLQRLKKADEKRVKRVILDRLAKKKKLEEMFNKSVSNQVVISDYLDKSQLEEFLTNKSVDSIDDLTNKAAMSKLEIIEFPP